jgi:hypothetical protein
VNSLDELRQWVKDKFGITTPIEGEEEPSGGEGFPVIERPDTYTAISRDGCPTSPWLERKRLRDADTSILKYIYGDNR